MRKVWLAALVLMAGSATVPAGAVVDHDGSVAGSGSWIASTEPGIPEQRGRVSVLASNEHHGIDCPSVRTCPPIGRALVTTDARVLLDVDITCLSVHDDEAFFSGFGRHGDVVVPVAGFVATDLTELSRSPSRLALRTGGFFDCRGERGRERLRAAAAPLADGMIAVIDRCRYAVCPADGGRPV